MKTLGFLAPSHKFGETAVAPSAPNGSGEWRSGFGRTAGRGFRTDRGGGKPRMFGSMVIKKSRLAHIEMEVSTKKMDLPKCV